jgi:uncharacterized protein with PQ loop repeat
MIDILRYFAYHIGPPLATILITVTYVPQIIKTFKTKSVEDMSLLFWILLNSFLFCIWINSLFAWIDSGNFGLFMMESINFLLAIIVIIQVLVYRKKK